MSQEKKEFHSLKEFYPFYLSEHSNRISRALHYVGSISVLILLFYGMISRQFHLLYFLPVAGYGPAWIGHFMFERNKPATFKYPVYSFLSDWIMLKDALLGRIK